MKVEPEGPAPGERVAAYPGVVVFEGPDGAGKTTLVAAVSERLKVLGVDHCRRRFPTDNPVGKLIRAFLSGDLKLDSHAILHLFASDFYDSLGRDEAFETNHIGRGVRTELDKMVLCDRWPPISCFAYQLEFHELPSVQAVYSPEHINPDCTFILSADSDLLEQRLLKRGEPLSVYERADSSSPSTRVGRRVSRAVVGRYASLRWLSTTRTVYLDARLSVSDLVEKVVAEITYDPAQMDASNAL